MLDFSKVKVIGIKETVLMLQELYSWMPRDSYETHIENPQTMNEAPFSFIVGKGDLDYILHNEKAMKIFLDGIQTIGPLFIEKDGGTRTMAIIGSYADLFEVLPYWKTKKKEIVDEYLAWFNELPYMEDILKAIDEQAAAVETVNEVIAEIEAKKQREAKDGDHA